MTAEATNPRERETYAHVVVDPHHWYPLEMTLQNCPSPGFPQDYVIACKRSKESGIRDESRILYGADDRFGEWDQRISSDLFLKILKALNSAWIRAFPSGQGFDWLCQGPLGQTFRLTYGGRTYEWSRYARATGWEALESAIDLMLEAVKHPAHIEAPEPYFGGPRRLLTEKARRVLEPPDATDGSNS